MRATDDALVAHLAARYPTSTAARALWLWAGGDPADVVRADWPGLWAAQPARRVPLVREALHDAPAHPLLLEWLARRADALHQATAGRAPAALEAAEELARAGDPEPTELARALAGLGARDEDEAFACLAPVCDEQLGASVRLRLERACEALVQRAAVVAALRALASPEAVAPALAPLRAALARARAAGVPEGDAVLVVADRYLGRVKQGHEAVEAVGALLELTTRDPFSAAQLVPDPVAVGAAGLRDALRGTAGPDEEREEEDEPDEDDPDEEVWT